MGYSRALGWCLAGLLLLFPAVGLANDPAPAGAGPAKAEAAPRGDRLFPFGIRTDGRPEKAPRAAKKRVAAVERGLEWLAAHQHKDGPWMSADLSWCHGKSLYSSLEGKGKRLYDPGVTGLALSAFLSAGYTHLDGSAYAEPIARGLKWLASIQDVEGCLGPRTSQHFIYNHAFGSLAVVEAYVVSGDERLLPLARKALAFSVLARNPYFAWRYGVKPGDNDTSATGCMSMAFLAARLANEAALAVGEEPPLPFPRDVLEGVRVWIDRMTDHDYGRTGYIQRGGAPARPQELIDKYPGEKSESCTAIGLLLRLHLPGPDAAKSARLNGRAIRLLHKVPPAWNPSDGSIDLYYWYYGCLALARAGSEAWTPWARAIEKELLGAQREDTDECQYLGSWDPAGPWGADGGRIYSTAACVLMLQAPHRFPLLPEDRFDLVEALGDGTRPTDETIRLLEAVAAYRVPGAQNTLIPKLKATEAPLRAVAARALAACHPNAAGVRSLGAVLKEDASADVRYEAAHGLGRTGDAAVAVLGALESGAQDADTRVRVAALETLRGLGKKAAKAATTVQSLLAHEVPAVRVAAAGALCRLAPETPAVEKVLLEGIGAKDETIRVKATIYLAGEEPKSPAAHAALTKALGDASLRVRVEAAHGVVSGAHDAPALLAVLRAGLAAKDTDTRVSTLRLVARMGPAAVDITPQVIESAMEAPVRIRREAVLALEPLGMGAPGAAAVLHACRRDAVPAIRELAIAACVRLHEDPAAVVEALTSGLTSKSPRILDGAVAGLTECGIASIDPLRALLAGAGEGTQARVIQILNELGTKARRALPEILAALDATTSADVKRDGARAIGVLGATDESAADRLIALLEEKDWGVRRAAMLSLAEVGKHQPKAVTVLGRVASITEKDRRHERLAALHALALTGRAALPILPSLMNAMGDEDREVRRAGARVVSGIGEPAVDVLLDAIRGVSDQFRQAAIGALAGMGDEGKKAIPELVKMIKTGSPWSAYEYVRALAGIGERSIRPLKRLLKDKKSAMVRAAAARGLGLIGPEAKSAVSTLKRLLKDKNPEVRREAKLALDRIRP